MGLTPLFGAIPYGQIREWRLEEVTYKVKVKEITSLRGVVQASVKEPV